MEIGLQLLLKQLKYDITATFPTDPQKLILQPPHKATSHWHLRANLCVTAKVRSVYTFLELCKASVNYRPQGYLFRIQNGPY